VTKVGAYSSRLDWPEAIHCNDRTSNGIFMQMEQTAFLSKLLPASLSVCSHWTVSDGTDTPHKTNYFY
jgi:hypothetical protein